MCEIGWFGAIIRTIPAQDFCVCVCACVHCRYEEQTVRRASIHTSTVRVVNVSATLDYTVFTCIARNSLGEDALDIQLVSTSIQVISVCFCLRLCISARLKFTRERGFFFFVFVKISTLLWKIGIKIIISFYELCGNELFRNWNRYVSGSEKESKINFLFQELLLFLFCVRRPLIITNPTLMHQTDSLLIDCCYARFISRFKN